ncbi:radical SAM family heme chaperone HemW [Gulosibacter sp. ACHW.36C]|uniref:Heme chaperone HemW n=1 Tax=Gulosibacter sediminis TaxID=1729695 RepID=A0ABY4MZU8_9MICO|nr:radical SAM family heme chaperone HemW [Gulosibacter sediminis]UQN15961.1 radical SAM family heme chaperone HemW [Gulosibacter sediminis]
MPPSALPDGDPVPQNGALPEAAAQGLTGRQFGAYVHIPFCRVRCGYCDFNTYTATELRGVSQSSYADAVAQEVALARGVLDDAGHREPLSTVFFGGGTPTLLPAADLVRTLATLRDTFGIVDDAEITTEANPDSVDEQYLRELVEGGFTRVSFGMQSAVPHVLRTLDRTHDPLRVPDVVAAAKAVGLDASVDLIYGTPGESLDDWRRSVDAALALAPTHISAYALIVEPGTALARQIRRGEVAEVDDDLQAEMYEYADAAFAKAGYRWYEISNWSLDGEHPSRHNLAYWHDTDWWGFGPGAHSHINGTRFWNVKHPAAYAQRLAQGDSPAAAREVLDDEQRYAERVLLRSRLVEGLPLAELRDRRGVAELIADGLVDGAAAIRGTLQLTVRGRLLADVVARALA